MDWSEFCRLGHTRTTRRADHALIAPDGHVLAPLPAWGGVPGIVLISPALGAGLAQYLVPLEPEQKVTLEASPDVERFVYVLEGSLALESVSGALGVGYFAFLPAGPAVQTLESRQRTRLMVFEKRYDPKPDVEPPTRVVGKEWDFEGKPFLGDPDAVLQVLLPETASFDMAVNIFTYQPGATLPFVETHIMEHGLFMLQGGGIYRLNDAWYPVTVGDCIWMAPYCPQWFAATGKTPARYLYYKDVNRNLL